MKLQLWLALLLCAAALVCSHDVEKRQARRLRARKLGTPRRRLQQGGAAPQVVDPTPAGKRVVCYYSNWSVYRKGIAKFVPQHINPYLCTHLVYAFAGLNDEMEMTAFDSYQDIDKGGYSQFAALKQYNKDLRNLLAVGGWEEGSARFSELVASPELRKVFTDSAIRHLRRYNFDGLDLDWEYPASRAGSAPSDKEHYVLLVKELKEAFEEEAAKSKRARLLLTMAVPAGQDTIDKGFDVAALNTYLDFFNILNYDYYSVMSPSVYNHAALLPMPGTSEYEDAYKLNVDWTVKYYVQLGADRQKLVVGIPTYGRTFTLADENFNEYGSAAIGPGAAGNYTTEKGFMPFYEICEAMAVNGWEASKPFPRAMGPYAHYGNQWVGYDDEGIVATKAEYVRDYGLGGIMFWSMDTDDFHGICSGRPYLLIEAGKAALLSSGRTDLNKLDNGNGVTSAPPATPVPPTTPSPTPSFVCKREGFHPNPENCHQYFWCLGSGGDLVAHTFTCPSGLVFSKSVDGCEHPDRARCDEKKKRGGQEATPPTPTIPTTTPFPPFDYDYYYYYEDEADYVDPAGSPPAGGRVTTTSTTTTTTGRPVRNSGGAQFTRTAAEAARGGGDAETEEAGVRQRNRPQYSSISRDRSQAAAAAAEPEEKAAAEGAEAAGPGGNNARRPQYTSIQRARPSTEAPLPEDPDYHDDSVTPSSRLNYVTIERQRPSTLEKVNEIAEAAETSTQSGLQYVTLRRRRPSVTTPSTDSSATEQPSNLFTVDSNSFRQRPARIDTTTESTTSTTTTTTTPRPARIVVPDVLLQPVTPSVVHRLNLDPRKRQRQKPKTVSLADERKPSSRTGAADQLTDAAAPEGDLEDYYYYYYDDAPLEEEVKGDAGSPASSNALDAGRGKDIPELREAQVADAVEADIPLPVADPENENPVGPIDPTTQSTTVNILAGFPGLAESIGTPDDEPALDSARDDKIPDVVAEEPTSSSEPPTTTTTTTTAVTTTAITTTTTTVAPATRRVPQLPPRPSRRPDSETPRAPQSDTPSPQRRPPSNRFTTTRSRFTPASGDDSATRRSSFRPASRDRPASSRFQNRGTAQTRDETTDTSSNNRFRNRQTSSTRFRLTPVPVTTSAPVRPRRPRPTTVERTRSRPNLQIRFRNREETTETSPEVTASDVVGDDVTEVDEPVTPNDIFALFSAGITPSSEAPLPDTPTNAPSEPEPRIPEAAAAPVDNLDSLVPASELASITHTGIPADADTSNVEDKSAGPQADVSEPEEINRQGSPGSTEVPFRFEDFFTPSTEETSATSPPQTTAAAPERVFTERTLRRTTELRTTTEPRTTSEPRTTELRTTSEPRTTEPRITTESQRSSEPQRTTESQRTREPLKTTESQRTTPPRRTTSLVRVEEETRTTTPIRTEAPQIRTTFVRTEATRSRSTPPEESQREIPDSDVQSTQSQTTATRRPPRLHQPSSTPTSTTRQTSPRRGGRPPRPRSSTLRPPSRIADYEYDYFFDVDSNGALGGTLGELADLTEKALLLPGGKVQCYDTGYFAHPDSCKKFISCSKTVRGAVRGWVYTCPQQLVFDPVGGMCNWAEAVDCKAPII